MHTPAQSRQVFLLQRVHRQRCKQRRQVLPETCPLSKGASFRQYLATLFAPLPVYALQEEDLAGLRGCVHAFAPRSPAGNAKRVALPKRRDAEKILEGYEVYAELFERVLGRVGNSPFHF